ncbi:hypothetical protein [Orientia tsutsugamushi]|uniref:hypothetical protein n=1 Tax=Orientia tsutsugamushi TaxID=784 RepID=UPI000697FFD0|nr:hypothetical protein [Orientia tsutsugamushi]
MKKKFRKEGLKLKIWPYPDLSIKEVRKKSKRIKDTNCERNRSKGSKTSTIYGRKLEAYKRKRKKS